MTSFSHLSPEIQTALARDMTIDITTTGRRSGKQRRIEIWFLNVGGAIYITGSTGRRDWYANLMANPDFVFHLKESTTADLVATATVVSEHDERRSVFEAATAKWYRDQEPLERLIADAPVLEINFS